MSRLLTTLFVAFVVPLLVVACVKKSEEADSDIVTEVNLPVQAVTVETIVQRSDLPGSITALPNHEVKLSPPISGRLTSVLVSPGQSVRVGQPVATLDNRQAQDQVRSAHAKVLVAQAGVSQALTAVSLAQATAARAERAFKAEVGAQKDVEAANSQIATAKAQLVAARAQVSDALASEALAKTQATYGIIRSPISGTVAARFLDVGEIADSNTPVVQIENLSAVQVVANLPTTEPSDVNVGDPLIVRAMTAPNLQFEGVVQSIDPITDTTGASVGIRGICANAGSVLKDGMPVSVTVTTAIHHNVVTVPATALVDDPSTPTQKMVCVDKSGIAKQRPVKTGLRTGNRVEILSGLVPGELIVVSGAYGLPDGTKIVRK